MPWKHPNGEAKEAVGSSVERSGNVWKNYHLTFPTPIPNPLLFPSHLLHRLDRQHTSFLVSSAHKDGHVTKIWLCDTSCSVLRDCQKALFLEVQILYLSLLPFLWIWIWWLHLQQPNGGHERKGKKIIKISAIEHLKHASKSYLQALWGKNKTIFISATLFLINYSKIISNWFKSRVTNLTIISMQIKIWARNQKKSWHRSEEI